MIQRDPSDLASWVHGMLAKAREWTESHSRTQGFLLVLMVLLAVYGLTGDYDGGLRHNVDTTASAIPAERLVLTGSLDVTPFQDINPWFVEVDGKYFSNRPPGATFLAVPFYLIAAPVLDMSRHTRAPSVVASFAMAAAAMALLYLTLREVTTPRASVVTALIIGLSTPTWSISATALWPHGPNQLFITGWMVVLLQRRGYWMLLPIGMLAVPTRPMMAVPLVVVGLWFLARREWPPAGWLAAGGALGLATMVLWTRWIFSSPVSESPYTGSFLDSPASLTPLVYIERLSGALLDPTRGVIFVTPIVALGISLAWSRMVEVKPEVRMFAVAGLAYFLAHLAFNRFNPGFHTNYRYWLEPITLAAPLVAVGIERGFESQTWSRVLAVAAFSGFTFQALHVLELNSVFGLASDNLPWSANR